MSTANRSGHDILGSPGHCCQSFATCMDIPAQGQALSGPSYHWFPLLREQPMWHIILGPEGNWICHSSWRNTQLPSLPSHPSRCTIHTYAALAMTTVLVIVNDDNRKITWEKTGSSRRARVWWIDIFLSQICWAVLRWSGWSSCQMLSLVARYRNQCGRNTSRHIDIDPGRPGRSTLRNFHACDLGQISLWLPCSSSPSSSLICSLPQVAVPWPLACGWQTTAAAAAWHFWADVLHGAWVVLERELVGALLTLCVNVRDWVTFTGG